MAEEKMASFNNYLDLMKGIAQPAGITLGTADLVKATGVPASQLRYWVEQGYVTTVTGPDQRSRKFSYRAVFRVRAIKYFLDNGYTLAYATAHVSRFNNLDVHLQQVVLDKMTALTITADDQAELSLGLINDGHDELHLTVQPDGQAKFWTTPEA